MKAITQTKKGHKKTKPGLLYPVDFSCMNFTTAGLLVIRGGSDKSLSTDRWITFFRMAPPISGHNKSVTEMNLNPKVFVFRAT